MYQQLSFSFLRPNIKICASRYIEKLDMKIFFFFILMEKMGKQFSRTPLKSPTMFRKYCVGVGEEGDLSLLL